MTTGFTHEASNQGATDEWYTPPEVFGALGLEFDLDPCSPGADVVPWVPARRHITLDENGLAQPWAGRVWLNPPYGAQTGRWLGKLAEHGDGVALVFARLDTRWAQRCVARAATVVVPRGRIAFVDATGNRRDRGTAPSMLLAFGTDCAAALERSGLGLVLRPVEGANGWLRL